MEDNLELLIRAKEGDERAKEELVEQNLGLVWSIARRFTGRGYDLEDLFQIGCIGLLKCISRFNMEYQVQFSTYAVPLIQGEIRRFLRDNGTIKISRNLREIHIKAETCRQKIIQEKGMEPGISEIAAMLSVSEEEIVMAMEAGGMTVESLDVPGIMAKQEEYSEELVDHIMLSQMIGELSDEEQQLIHLRFFEDQTQSETGRVMGISQVQVSRMEKKILSGMRKKAENES